MSNRMTSMIFGAITSIVTGCAGNSALESATKAAPPQPDARIQRAVTVFNNIFTRTAADGSVKGVTVGMEDGSRKLIWSPVALRADGTGFVNITRHDASRNDQGQIILDDAGHMSFKVRNLPLTLKIDSQDRLVIAVRSGESDETDYAVRIESDTALSYFQTSLHPYRSDKVEGKPFQLENAGIRAALSASGKSEYHIISETYKITSESFIEGNWVKDTAGNIEKDEVGEGRQKTLPTTRLPELLSQGIVAPEHESIDWLWIEL